MHPDPPPSIDHRQVFVGTADPDFRIGPKKLRQYLALHALVVGTPVLQDNFLLSGQSMSLEAKDPLLSFLIGSGVLTVALRSTANGLIPVSRAQAKNANEGRFTAFAGDDSALYSSREFDQYVATVDTAITKGGNALRWDPVALGTRYRYKMASSADECEWETTEDRLMLVFSEVENEARTEGRVTHSCSDYFRAADRVSSPVDRDLVKQWARSFYLTNLPDVLKIASWLPVSLLEQHRNYSTIQHLFPSKVDADLEVEEGLLNSYFLLNVPGEAILELRSETSFLAMQEARANVDEPAFRLEFSRYKKRVYDFASRQLANGNSRYRRLDKVANAAETISKASGVFGSGVLTVGLAFLFPTLPAVGAAGAVATYGIKLFSDSGARKAREQQEKLVNEARNQLRESRYRGCVLSLVDVVHRPRDGAEA